MINVVFWLQNLSPHQLPYIRPLAEGGHCRVTVVVEKEMGRDRAALGWSVPDIGQTDVVVSSQQDVARAVIDRAGSEAISVIGGLRNFPLGRFVLKGQASRGARVGIISEGACPDGWMGHLRRLIYSRDQRLFGKAIDFILAIGDPGIQWFQKCGYACQKLFPFGYCTDSQRRGDVQHWSDGCKDSVQLIYIGRCVPGKGVDDLLRALRLCAGLEWTLTVIGEGPLRIQWCELASRLGLRDRVHFLGAQPHALAMNELCSKDVLVLPSKGKEGWGAVVNEALMRGVPVICSSRCGASDLIREPWLGEVFRAGSVEALTDVLARWIGQGRRTQAQSERLRHWSQCIDGESVGRYFLQILDHVYEGGVRPTPPWRLPSNTALGNGTPGTERSRTV